MVVTDLVVELSKGHTSISNTLFLECVINHQKESEINHRNYQTRRKTTMCKSI